VIARFLTTTMVIGLCSLAVLRGWSLVEFASARGVGDDEKGAAVDAWIGAPLVTTAALDVALDDGAGANDPEAANRRVALLTQLLSVRPLSSIAWLSLAGMRLATGAPYKDVLSALKMSSITGANEGAVMWQRGLFGLLQWTALPPDFQRRAILDLSGPIIVGFIDDRNVEQIRGLLGVKTPELRAQIAELLGAQGVTAGQLTRIGLGGPQSKP
jgi:hypothetical protein